MRYKSATEEEIKNVKQIKDVFNIIELKENNDKVSVKFTVETFFR